MIITKSGYARVHACCGLSNRYGRRHAKAINYPRKGRDQLFREHLRRATT